MENYPGKISESNILYITVPNHDNPIDVLLDNKIQIPVIYDYTDFDPDYSSDQWWYYDEKVKTVHVMIANDLRTRYLAIVQKREAGQFLSTIEEKELKDCEHIINAMPQLAAEKAIVLYGTNEKREKKKYRTRKNAGEVAEIPTQLATITNPNYQNSTSLYKKGNAYLQPLVSADGLKSENGKLFFKGLPATIAMLKDSFTNTIPETLDLSFLQLCFSIILTNFNATMIEDNTVNQVISIYYPKLAQAIGKPHNISRSDVVTFIKKISSYQTIVGIIDTEIQPVLLYIGEDREKNIIYMSSPYLVKVARTLFKVSIRKNKKGEPLLKKDGTPKLYPAYSYLINSSITKERNKKAVENVRIIVATIEQAGNTAPHIKARTIIQRNLQLKNSIEGKPTNNQNTILKRTFQKTWELLHTQTNLDVVYKNIQLPDPSDSSTIPTVSTLDMVFNFPHGGKKNVGEVW